MNIKFYLLILLTFTFTPACKLAPFVQSVSRPHCYDSGLTYNRGQRRWENQRGEEVLCRIHDNKVIFPAYNGRCDLAEKSLSVGAKHLAKKKLKEEDLKKADDFGYKIELVRIILHDQPVCVLQEYIEYRGGVIPLGDSDLTGKLPRYCLAREKGESYLMEDCEEKNN